MKLSIKLLFAAFIAFSISSCIKEREDVIPETHNHGNGHEEAKAGDIEMHFSGKVGEDDLVLGDTWYTTHSGDSFQVSLFNYYISNVVFHTMNGDTYAEPESYHLVMQSDAASQKFTVNEVPAGHYTAVSFMIGVDAPRNTAGAQTGALDPIHGMFWTWNTGYIMAKLEGKAPKASNGKLMYHIGGFSGDNSVLKTVKLTFTEHKVIDGNTAHIHFNADVAKWFHGTHHIDFSMLNMVHMPGAGAKKIADNYEHMFSQEDHH